MEIDPTKRVFVHMPQFPDHQILFVADFFRYYVKRYKWCYAKNTWFRRMYEKWLDFWFTGPLTPRRLMVWLYAIWIKIRVFLKSFLITKLPKVYLKLRRIKNRIK